MRAHCTDGTSAAALQATELPGLPAGLTQAANSGTISPPFLGAGRQVTSPAA